IELLVVIGLTPPPTAPPLPTPSPARHYAHRVTCQANLRTIGELLLMYANTYDGWVYPIGPGDPNDPPAADNFCRMGDMLPPEKRWPVYVKGLERFNHPLLFCPTDQEPVAEHSYALNCFLASHHARVNRGP